MYTHITFIYRWIVTADKNWTPWGVNDMKMYVKVIQHGNVRTGCRSESKVSKKPKLSNSGKFCLLVKMFFFT